MAKTERDYINEILFLIGRQSAKIEKLNAASGGDETTDTGHAFRTGQLMAYREVASQL